MSNSSDWLAAAFVIPRAVEDDSLTLFELLQSAGASEIATKPDEIGLLFCTWAGWTCRSYLETLPTHRVLYIYFRERDFYTVASEDEPPLEANPLVQAFELACARLLPDAAIIITLTWQANPDFVHQYVPAIVQQNADTLINARFGVLYLNNDLSNSLSDQELPGRDTLRMDSGLMLFAGEGERRWH